MPVLIDIEVPADATLLMVRRADGSLTVSVDPRAVITAVRQWSEAQDTLSRFISEPVSVLAN